MHNANIYTKDTYFVSTCVFFYQRKCKPLNHNKIGRVSANKIMKGTFLL